MGLIEFHVDRIDVRTVPKFVLFGGADGEETDTTGDGEAKTTAVTGSNCPLPVSPSKVLAVSLAATVLAFAVAKVAGLVDSKLDLHC